MSSNEETCSKDMEIVDCVDSDVKQEELDLKPVTTSASSDTDVTTDHKQEVEDEKQSEDITGGMKVVKDALNQFAANQDEDVTVYHVTEKCKKISCYVGIDEAGRGPVLGPMVYSIFACVADENCITEKKKKGQSLSKIEESPPVLLDNAKFSKLNDSKQLTEKVRDEILEKFSDLDYISFGIKIISPSQIAQKSYRRQKYSLNEVSHNAAIELIQGLADRNVKLERVYVDTVGPMEAYQKKLEMKFPDIRFKVDKKADAKYKPVSAASVCAKVTRDIALKNWKFSQGENIQMGTAAGWGSGYPADPVTKKFLRKNIDPIFGFPNIVRNSWSTASDLLDKCAVKIKWESDEKDEASAPKISKYFAKKAANGSNGHHENGNEKTPEIARRKSQFFNYRDLHQTVSIF